MKLIRKGWPCLLAFSLTLALLSGCARVAKPAEKTPMLAFEDLNIQRGINMGNCLEAPTPGEWGVSIEPDHFRVIRQAGFDTVRLPVRFSAHTSAQPPYEIESNFLQLVDEVISWALANDLRVVLDLHHYEQIMHDPQAERERFLAIWEQLSTHYQDAPPSLYFELLNEPQQQLDAQTWNSLLAEALAVIRRSNPSRKVIVGGVDYSNVAFLAALQLPTDKNLIATFHYYEPFHFTHQGASWVDGAEAWVGTLWQEDAEKKQAIREQLDNAAAWSRKQRVGLVLGEFGAIAVADQRSRQRWTAFIAREVEKRNIGWVYWDFCAEFRVYNCASDEWDLPLLRSLVPEP